MDLDHLRTVQARSLYANYTLTMVTVGIHIFMAFYGFNVFSETPKRLRKGRMRYIVASVVITCLTAFAASLDMAGYFQVLFASTSPSHWRTLMVTKSPGWEALLSGTCVAMLVWIGDALLVYRCYVIWADSWWIVAFPGATFAGALVINLLAIFAPSDHGRQYVGAYTLLTVTTNLTVTGLIVFRILSTRQAMSNVLPSKEIQLYTGPVAILIESALPLSIFGVVTGAMMLAIDARTQRPSPSLLTCYNTFSGLFFAFCTLSPHMIIFRVTVGRSFLRFPSLTDSVALSPIDFDRQTNKSSSCPSSFEKHDISSSAETDVERLGGTSFGKELTSQQSPEHLKSLTLV